MSIDVNIRIRGQAVPADDGEFATMVGDDSVRFIYLPGGNWILTPQARSSSLTIECEPGTVIDGSTTADVLIQLSGSVSGIRILGGTWQNCQSIVSHTGTSAMVACEFRGLSVVNVPAPFVCSAAVGCRWVDCGFSGVSTVHCIHFAGTGQSNANQIVRCRNLGTSGRLVRLSTSDSANHNHIVDCWSEDNLSGGGLLEVVSSAFGLHIMACYTENNAGSDYLITPASGKSARSVSLRDCYFATEGDYSRVYMSGTTHIHAAGNVVNLDTGIVFCEIATANVYTNHLFENQLNAIGGGDYADRLFTKSGSQAVVYSTQVSGFVTNDAPQLVSPGEIHAGTPYRPEQFGAAGDGVTDDTAALQAMFSAIPGGDSSWSAGFHLRRTYTVEFGSVKHYITGQLTIPDYRGIVIRGGDGPYGALIEHIDDLSPTFKFNSLASANIQNTLIENLAFKGGGILFGGGGTQNQQGQSVVRYCRFHECQGNAIEVGVRNVEGLVESCWFDKCGTAVNFNGVDSDLWTVQKCGIIRSRGDGIRIATSGVKVLNCEFEQKEIGYVDSAFILVERGRDVVIDGNRFGNEPQTPRECIRIERNGSTNVYGVRITNNSFAGAGSLSSDPEAGLYAINIKSPPQAILISHNRFFNYDSAIIGEDWFSLDANGAAGVRMSLFVNNLMQDLPQDHYSPEQIFEAGGLGFMGHVGEILEPTETLNQNVAGWTKSNTTVVDDGDGEFTITRSADAGSAYVLSLTPAAPELPARASVWLKAGTYSVAMVSLLDTSNRYLYSLSAVLPLSDRWRKVEIPLGGLNAGLPARMIIYVGIPGVGGTAGDNIKVRLPSIVETGKP